MKLQQNINNQTDFIESKTDIRQKLLKKRNTLTKERRQKYSKLIEERLFLSEQYQNAEILLIYISYLSEVSTYGIINHSLNTGKKVFCPKVLNHGIMDFYEIASLDDVILGYKNIPEPKATGFPYNNQNPIKTLMIMPLVGFDEAKNRIGYGGGFYDRYLQNFPSLNRIGLGFECQRYEGEIPVEKTDIKPNFIFTEKLIL